MGAMLRAAWQNLDGSPVPLGSNLTHDPIGMPKSLWARWKLLEVTKTLKGMTFWGQTETIV